MMGLAIIDRPDEMSDEMERDVVNSRHIAEYYDVKCAKLVDATITALIYSVKT